MTSLGVSVSNFLKFSTKRCASCKYFLSYSALLLHEEEGSKISSGTSGQCIGTSKPNTGSVLYWTLSSLPVRAAFSKARVYLMEIRLPTPYAPPTQPVLTSQHLTPYRSILPLRSSAY